MFCAASSLRRRFAAGVSWFMAAVGAVAPPIEPLPSWNAGASKARIGVFVQPVAEHRGKNFVAASERIAVFDNDATPWAGQPVRFQAPFMAPTRETTVFPPVEGA